MPRTTLQRCLTIACLICLGLGAPQASAFDFSSVAQIAEKMAGQPHQKPAAVPSFLTKLDHDKYEQIRFLSKRTLWSESQTNFQFVLAPPGNMYHQTVQINIVDAEGVHTLPFHKDWFAWPGKLKKKIPDGLGYAGLRLTFPLNAPDQHNQFLVFAGASYFRGLARHQTFGLSARGIAVDTGLASGEEFPSFTQFWLVRPSPQAKVMKLYALLDGASLTGAYQFVVFPGAPTRIEVHARLFTRNQIKLLGFAPLTSMFLYGKNTPRPPGRWHPAVHDSGGLLIHSGTGEWLWRPLINPPQLQTDYFAANSPRGFGLLQRDTQFADYEDPRRRYDARPSAWITPHGDWGKGDVVLVELPSGSETNDNIVAFWSPKKKAAAGHTYDLHYTLRLGKPDIPREPMAHVVATHVGHGPTPETSGTDAASYRIAVDFAGGPLAKLQPGASIQAVVTGLDGTIIKHKSVHWIDASQQWRLRMTVKPESGKPVALRAFLKQGNNTLSETWSYSLPDKNRFTSK